MNEVIFAKSSSNPDSPYGVSFIVEGRKLYIDCPCTAGMYGQLCKHRVAFLRGDERMLADVEQKPLLEQLQKLAAETVLADTLNNYLALEREIQKLKASLKNTKRELARQMGEGVKLNKKSG